MYILIVKIFIVFFSDTQFTSLPCAQRPGGVDPCIDTKDVLKLLIVGDSAVRLLVTLGARSAW
jgi:hypothetical protein